jgi:hypothetical protein
MVYYGGLEWLARDTRKLPVLKDGSQQGRTNGRSGRWCIGIGIVVGSSGGVVVVVVVVMVVAVVVVVGVGVGVVVVVVVVVGQM